jgi:hypothetical protein
MGDEVNDGAGWRATEVGVAGVAGPPCVGPHEGEFINRFSIVQVVRVICNDFRCLGEGADGIVLYI